MGTNNLSTISQLMAVGCFWCRPPRIWSEMLKPFVLKVRGGCPTYVKADGKTGTAGKGALWAEDVTFTL